MRLRLTRTAPPSQAHGWVPFTVLVPVKSGTQAKSRLHADPILRLAFARAFACDTVEAALTAEMVGRVVVVTNDEEIAIVFRKMGARIIRERRSSVHDGLNEAIMQGRDWALRHHRYEPIAVVPADLPALTGLVLDDLLAVAQQHEQAFCMDAKKTGTTVLTAAEPIALNPAYGYCSAEEHEARGAVRLDAISPNVCNDIDTMSDLAEAQPLGLGRHTQAVLRKFAVGLSAESSAPMMHV